MIRMPGDQDLVELNDLPVASTGAPGVVVHATSDHLIVSYVTIGEASSRVIVEFERPCAHRLGPPNDETLHGHPLVKFGLRPHSVFEVKHSSWISDLERMNRVHPRHSAALFAGLRHFIFTLKEDTLEVVAVSYRLVEGADFLAYLGAIPRFDN